MEKFKAIVIDDEIIIRDGIVNMILEHCPQIEIVGVAGSAAEGRKLIKKFSIDFIFLDIMMPNEDGFAFLETIKKEDYCLIFTTAYNEHALRALKANAIEYLLKPISPFELISAVNKAIAYHGMRSRNLEVRNVYYESLGNLHNQLARRPSRIIRLTVPEQFGFRVIDVRTVMYLEAEGNYTRIYLTDESRLLATRNLGEFEKIIEDDSFFRIHKSLLLNVNYLNGFSSYEGFFAVLKDGTRLSISRRKFMDFRSWVKGYSFSID